MFLKSVKLKSTNSLYGLKNKETNKQMNILNSPKPHIYSTVSSQMQSEDGICNSSRQIN